MYDTPPSGRWQRPAPSSFSHDDGIYDTPRCLPPQTDCETEVMTLFSGLFLTCWYIFLISCFSSCCLIHFSTSTMPKSHLTFSQMFHYFSSLIERVRQRLRSLRKRSRGCPLTSERHAKGNCFWKRGKTVVFVSAQVQRPIGMTIEHPATISSHIPPPPA